MISRFTKRILDMEIQLIKLKERNESLEKKLTEKSDLLQTTRKELTRCQKELAKLKWENEQLPIVRSELLNVCIIRHNF